MKSQTRAVNSTDFVDANKFEELKTYNEKMHKTIEKLSKKIKKLKENHKKKLEDLEHNLARKAEKDSLIHD